MKILLMKISSPRIEEVGTPFIADFPADSTDAELVSNNNPICKSKKFNLQKALLVFGKNSNIGTGGSDGRLRFWSKNTEKLTLGNGKSGSVNDVDILEDEQTVISHFEIHSSQLIC